MSNKITQREINEIASKAAPEFEHAGVPYLESCAPITVPPPDKAVKEDACKSGFEARYAGKLLTEGPHRDAAEGTPERHYHAAWVAGWWRAHATPGVPPIDAAV